MKQLTTHEKEILFSGFPDTNNFFKKNEEELLTYAVKVFSVKIK